MKNNYFTVILIILSMIVLFFSYLFSHYRFDLINQPTTARISLPPGTILSQKFIPDHDNLFRIMIMDADNPIINNQTTINDHLQLKLVDTKSQTVIRALDFSALNIGTMEKLPFTFEPVPGSKNRRLQLQLISLGNPDSSPSHLLSFGVSDQKLNNQFNLKLDNSDYAGGSLSIRTYYRDRIINLMADSAADFLHRISRDKSFAVFYLSTVTILLFLIFRK